MRHVDASSLNNSSEESDEYRVRREKNNESVRKSRAKNRVKVEECVERIQELKQENKQLNTHLDSLQSELYTLKGLFQHCFSFDKLSVKPSEIPTSTLYKLIMKSGKGTPIQQSQELNTCDDSLNKTDYFHINQIKDSLANFVNYDRSVVASSDANILRTSISQDHDYTLNNAI